jgi:hypothetical protein
MIPDINSSDGKFNFTDGCGFIGEGLARLIIDNLYPSQSFPIPSVIQLRWQGFKGIVTLNRSISPETMQLRPSLKKFETNAFPTLCVADHSRPYVLGSLNLQYIMLLSACGVPDEVFLAKQQEHFQMLDTMLVDPEVAVYALSTYGKNKFPDLFRMKGVPPQFPAGDCSEIMKELREIKRKSMTDPEKLRIMVPQSRNIFGVCDRHGVLSYGECMLRVTMHGQPTTIRGLVVVSKNPCYLRGDIRVLQAVDSSKYPALREVERDLVDCLVYPTKG